MLQRYGNGKRLDTTLSKCDELEYKLYHKHYNKDDNECITRDDVLQLKDDDIYLYPYECIIDYLPLFSGRKLRALTDRAKQKLKSFEWNYKGIKDYYKQARYKYYYR